MNAARQDLVSFHDLSPGNELADLRLKKFSDLLKEKNNPGQSRLMIHTVKSINPIALAISCWSLHIPYIPVDLANPVPRIRQLVEQTLPEFMLIDKNADFFKEIIATKFSYEVLWEEENEILIYFKNQQPLSHAPKLACILFTSGSTGQPKGVMISRKNISAFVGWMTTQFHINNSSRILSVSPLHFDLSVFDLYAGLTTGAKLFVPPQSMLVNPLFLAEYISTNQITAIYATPTWFQLLVNFGKPYRFVFDHVKTLLLAGEPFKVVLAEQLNKIFPNAAIANLYGPTETNVCTFYQLDFSQPLKQQNGVLSIGSNCPYIQSHISENNTLVVQGDTVMMGYWPNVGNELIYDTGDVVEKKSGDYYFVARADHMIKRNGYRIEPSEIESCLLLFQGIIQAAVTASVQQERIIITAHIVGNDFNHDALRAHCLKHLPHYMLPDEFKSHAQLPLNPSGKTDYKALTFYGK